MINWDQQNAKYPFDVFIMFNRKCLCGQSGELLNECILHFTKSVVNVYTLNIDKMSSLIKIRMRFIIIDISNLILSKNAKILRKAAIY